MKPADLLAFIREANSLEAIRRGGFIISGIPDGESVQAHSHGVALTALGLAELEGQPFDAGKVLLMALLHDLGEARIGDIVLRYQHYFPAGAIHAAEAAAGRDILEPMSARFRAAFEELTAGKSLEARLVHAADKLQMMVKVCAYEDQQRGALEKFWQNPANFRDCGLKSVRACHQALAKARGRKLPDEELTTKARRARRKK